MKINLPVTGHEKLFSHEKTLVSKTDTMGIITFANKDFVEISGFTENELVDANHNIIRHPDMPPVAFEVMWKTLKRGVPWRGVVKNRCKNGDHYWVDAKVVPIKKSGRIIGYMSVRTCPSRQDVAAAEAAYQLAATAPQTITEAADADWKKYLSIKNGIPLWILFVTLMMIAGGILGISGLNLSNSAIESLYHEEMKPVQTIGRIHLLMGDNRAQVALALHHNPSAHTGAGPDHPLDFHLQTLGKNKDEIDRLWASYAKQIDDATEKRLAVEYWHARNRYVEDGLLKTREALENADYARAELLVNTSVTPLYERADARATALLEYLAARGEAKFSEVAERNRNIARIAIAGIMLGCLVLVVCGIFFYRFTVMPLHKAVLALEDIAEGNLSAKVGTGGYGEPARVMAAVDVMQMHLKVMMHEIRQSSDSIYRQCHNLNETMMNLAEHSEEQHDRVYQTLDAIGESCSGLRAMANQAESLMQGIGDSSAWAPMESTATDAQDCGLEPAPDELLALFGESAAPVARQPIAAATEVLAEDTPRASSQGRSGGVAHEVACTARMQAFAVDDVAAQLKQIAALIVQNREDVQGAWAASQQLEQTARELDKLVKYFE
jgi:aerotaxis receptor